MASFKSGRANFLISHERVHEPSGAVEEAVESSSPPLNHETVTFMSFIRARS